MSVVWLLLTLLDKCVGAGREGGEEREQDRGMGGGKSGGERQKRE